jgi:hypothetical protein
MGPSSVARTLHSPGPHSDQLPPMSSDAPAPSRLPAQKLALVAPVEAVRSHTHAQLQQEEGWSERKEHWATTRD